MKINFRSRTNSLWGPWEHPLICFAGPRGGVADADRPAFLIKLTLGGVQEKKFERGIERDAELNMAFNALSRTEKCSVIFVGPPGVGKTVLLQTMALDILEGRYEQFKDHVLLEIDAAALTAGQLAPGELEERIKGVRDYLRRIEGKAIIFMDEAQKLLGLTGVAGPLIDHLKEDLAREGVKLIGAATTRDFLATVKRDSALLRRLNVFDLSAPTVDQTIEMLRYKVEYYQKQFSNKAGKKVTIPDTILEEAVFLADKHIKKSYFPDKALDVIDGACSLRTNALESCQRSLASTVRKIHSQVKKALRGIKNEEQQQVVDAKKALIGLISEYYRLKEQIRVIKEETEIVIRKEDLLQAISDKYRIPIEKLREDEKEKLLKLEELLSLRIIGQEEAKKALANAVRTARAMKEPSKTQGVLFFAGPTGVGKTEIVLALAEILFGKETFMTKLDMAEYSEPHSVAQLKGAPPGYVGHGSGGRLTQPVIDRPHQIVMFDEIEKANIKVHESLLSVFDSAKMTDTEGKVADFSNVLCVMTANVGAREIQMATQGIEDPEKRAAARKQVFYQALKQAFSPEFINRIDNVIYFDSLTREMMIPIIDLQINRLAKLLWQEQKYQIRISQAAKELILEKGYDPEYGARPLRRAIMNLLKEPLSPAILTSAYLPGSIIDVDRDGDALVFKYAGEVALEEFTIPDLEGRIGILVHRALTLIDQRAAKGDTDVAVADIEEFLFPKDEKVAEALTKVVAKGLFPTGTVRMADNDFRRKDKALMQFLPSLKQLMQVAGFNADVIEAMLDFAYYISIYAKEANVENNVMNKTPTLQFNFDGQNLNLTFRTSLLMPQSAVRRKINASLDVPKPISDEEVRAAAEKIGAEADLNLLELKRKLLKAKASFVFGDAQKEAVLYAQVRLFEAQVKKTIKQQIEEDLAKGPQPTKRKPIPELEPGPSGPASTVTQPIDPTAADAIPLPVVKLLQDLSQDRLDKKTERDLIAQVKALGPNVKSKVLNGLMRIFFNHDEPPLRQVRALKVYCAAAENRETLLNCGKYLLYLAKDKQDTSNIVTLMLTDDNTANLAAAVLRMVLASYSKGEEAPAYRKYFDQVVKMVATGKYEGGEEILGKWLQSLPDKEQQSFRSKYFPSGNLPLLVGMPSPDLPPIDFIELSAVKVDEPLAESAQAPVPAPQPAENATKPILVGPNYQVNASGRLLFSIALAQVPVYLTQITHEGQLLGYLNKLAESLKSVKKIDADATEHIKQIYQQGLLMIINHTRSEMLISVLHQLLTPFNFLAQNSSCGQVKMIAKEITREIRRLRDSRQK